MFCVNRDVAKSRRAAARAAKRCFPTGTFVAPPGSEGGVPWGRSCSWQRRSPSAQRHVIRTSTRHPVGWCPWKPQRPFRRGTLSLRVRFPAVRPRLAQRLARGRSESLRIRARLRRRRRSWLRGHWSQGQRLEHERKPCALFRPHRLQVRGSILVCGPSRLRRRGERCRRIRQPGRGDNLLLPRRSRRAPS